MNKIFRCAVLTVFVLFMIVIFCVSEDTKTYTSEDIGFSIDYPALWNPTKVTGGKIVVLFTAGAINRNLQVMHDQGLRKEGWLRWKGWLESFKTRTCSPPSGER